MFANAEVISSYSRAQAIDDGVLVDLSAAAPDVCRQHYKFAIACTAAAWAIIDHAVKNKRHCNDINGVVHDLLFMSRHCFCELDQHSREFSVIIKGAGRKSRFTFKLVCGPGDDAEPVLTLMLPDED